MRKITEKKLLKSLQASYCDQNTQLFRNFLKYQRNSKIWSNFEKGLLLLPVWKCKVDMFVNISDYYAVVFKPCGCSSNCRDLGYCRLYMMELFCKNNGLNFAYKITMFQVQAHREENFRLLKSWICSKYHLLLRKYLTANV